MAMALTVVGCATSPPPSERGATDNFWPALSPASLGASITASQVLRVAFGEREATLNCAVAVQPELLTIVGVTALGMRAFTVKFDGSQVSAESQPGVPEMLPPQRLLNDVQLTYWPLRALQLQLARTEWEVTEPAPGTRRLKRAGRLIAEVHYAGSDPWSGRVWLSNLEFGYTLSIDSQRLADVTR